MNKNNIGDFPGFCVDKRAPKSVKSQNERAIILKRVNKELIPSVESPNLFDLEILELNHSE